MAEEKDEVEEVEDEFSSPEDRGDFVEEDQEEQDDEQEDEQEEEHEEVDARQEKEIMIPKGRFDQERFRRMKAETELEELKERSALKKEEPVVDEKSIDELDQEAIDLAVQGDTAGARELRRQVLQRMEKNATEAALKAFETRSAEVERTREENELKIAAAEVKKLHPDLDDDPELVKELVDYRDFLKYQRGVPWPEALKQAAKRVLGDGKKPSIGDPNAERKAAEMRKASDSSRRQPPLTGSSGNRDQMSNRLPSKMTEKEFESLTPAELRKMRGDSM